MNVRNATYHDAGISEVFQQKIDLWRIAKVVPRAPYKRLVKNIKRQGF
ncbi:hypothetical protein [Mucilaginibacter mallensis]|nr:hypothetical protein [Mucilaginibacter mallensis]